MRPNAAVVATASLLLFALTGCSAPAATAGTPTPTPSPTPPPAASEPLACDDLVPAGLVAAALEGSDGVPVDPVAAVQSSRSQAFDAALLDGAGGLSCSWRVGAGMPEYNTPSDWAYLRVDVLPGGAHHWTPDLGGEGREPALRRIAGVDAATSYADPGWTISAPVGDSWVLATMSAAARGTTGGRFAGIPGPVMMDRLAEVAAAAYTTLEQSTPGELEWPTVELRQTEAMCNGGLDEAGIVAALQVPANAAVEYTMADATATTPTDFGSAVRAAARTFDCVVSVDGRPQLWITTARGFSPLFDRLRAPDADVALSPLDLADAPTGTEAVASGNGRASVVVLSLGGTLYLVSGENAPAVAQAIVAQTY